MRNVIEWKNERLSGMIQDDFSICAEILDKNFFNAHMLCVCSLPHAYELKRVKSNLGLLKVVLI